MLTAYNQDVVAWANEQAALLRAGKLADLDLENLAEEIDSVGISQRNELINRMRTLLTHLLKWRYQPEKRETGSSWRNTINEQRAALETLLEGSPSLKSKFEDEGWLTRVWERSLKAASSETGLSEKAFPQVPIWPVEEILAHNFWPEPPRQEVQ